MNYANVNSTLLNIDETKEKHPHKDINVCQVCPTQSKLSEMKPVIFMCASNQLVLLFFNQVIYTLLKSSLPVALIKPAISDFLPLFTGYHPNSDVTFSADNGVLTKISLFTHPGKHCLCLECLDKGEFL